MRMRTTVLAVTTLLTVVGCAGSEAAPDSSATAVHKSAGSDAPGSPASSDSSPDRIRLVEESQADLHLWVSNQSFKDDPVVLRITIDGTEVVAQPFEVEGQHNWMLFPIKVPPGEHMLNVVSDRGVELREPFTLPANDPRYAVVDYWNYSDEDGRHITWRIQNTPMAFA